jgi:hypothetical protein
MKLVCLQVISLRLAGRFGGEGQEIVLRTSEPAAATAVPGPSTSQFASPNVVAPTDGDPIPPFTSANKSSPSSTFPFASMTHAASAIQVRPVHVYWGIMHYTLFKTFRRFVGRLSWIPSPFSLSFVKCIYKYIGNCQNVSLCLLITSRCFKRNF